MTNLIAGRDRVLVVDDDPIIRFMARGCLGESGFMVDDAAGASEAMHALESFRPDVVLLDLVMSGADGFAICREIRSSAIAADTPVVMITGHDDAASITLAYEAGATDFVTKPVKWEVLAHRLRHIIKASRTEQELARSRENYQDLFENNPHPMWVFDQETLAILAVNEAAVRHYGYTRDEFLSITINDIRPPEDAPRICQRVVDTPEGLDVAGVWLHRKKDGTLIDVEVTAHATIFAGRKAKLVLANDVTERLRSQRALAQSREKYQTLFDGVSDILYVIASDGTFTGLNMGFEAVTGWSRLEWVGRSFADLIHPDDLETALALFQSGMAGNAEPAFELRVLGKTGEVKTIEVSLTPQVTAGEVTGVSGIARDLTQRRKVEQELQRADRALQTVSDCNKAMIYANDEQSLLDEICRSIVANRGYRFAWVGYPQHDEAQTVRPMAMGGDDEGYLDEVEVTWGETETGRGPAGNAIRTGRPRVVRDMSNDPEFAHWQGAARRRGLNSVIALPLLENGAVFAVLVIYSAEIGAFDEAEVKLLDELASNLSYGILSLRVRREHRRAEKSLKKSQAQLTEALQLAKLGDWCWDGKNYVSWGLELYHVFDIDPETAPPLFAQQEGFFTADSWRLYDSAVRRTLEKGESFQLDLEMVTPARVRKWIIARGAAVRNREGDIVGIHGTCQDVTEMRLAQNAEAELLESLALLSRAVEQSPVSIVIADTEGNIEFVNPKFTQVSGYELAEVLGQSVRMLKSPEVTPEQFDAMWEIISSGHPWHGNFLNRKKNGEDFLEVVAISPVKNREGMITHYVAVKEDVTEHRKLEEQLRHAQKMEAIGTLAGGIAHDFNNILTSVLGYCNLMQRKLTADDPLSGYVSKVAGAAERAAALTRGLLTYSRKEPGKTRPLNLNDVVVQVDHLLSKLLTEDIELRVRPSGSALVVMGDAVQLEQVLMNLASNARDAMVRGGVIEITTGSQVVERELSIASGCLKPGKYAVITVADNGTGMERETMARIFEPYFTTKEVGKGSGLGLSITYGIVNQHGGCIDVESHPGRGTTFTIYLPISGSVKSFPLPSVQPDAETGRETVLLVDDDRLIREIFKEVLEDAGYRVVTAADGEEGIARFREHADEIQLLILDVIMPRKNGLAVYEEIKKDSPSIKAFFISGYSADILSERALLVEQNVSVLPKPMTPKILLSKVREVLDADFMEVRERALAQ